MYNNNDDWDRLSPRQQDERRVLNNEMSPEEYRGIWGALLEFLGFGAKDESDELDNLLGK